MLIKGREKVGIKQTKSLEDYYPTNKRKVFMVFDDDMESNKKLSPIVKELFLRGRKLNISLVLYHNLISKCLKLLD